jgi:hypothetical protein
MSFRPNAATPVILFPPRPSGKRYESGGVDGDARETSTSESGPRLTTVRSVKRPREAHPSRSGRKRSFTRQKTGPPRA